MIDPILNPHAGDSVIARIGDVYVTRTVVDNNCGNITYDDSRKTKTQSCWIGSWMEWCRKNKAEVIDDKDKKQ